VSDTKYKDYIDELKFNITNYANNDEECGWFVIEHEGETFSFPKRAIMWAVFGNSNAISKLLPEYEAFSDYGLKMQGDNVFHTDCWLGAGFDIEDAYEHNTKESQAWVNAMYQIEHSFEDLLSFDFIILANELKTKENLMNARVYQYDKPLGKNSWSSTHIDCADKPSENHGQLRCIVIPNASVEYDLAVRNADIIITETGGKLSHLATVSREKGKLMIRMDDAVERFPNFTKFWINLDDLSLELYT